MKRKIFDYSFEIIKTPESRKDEKLFSKLTEMEQRAIFDENGNSSSRVPSSVRKNILSELGDSGINDKSVIVSYVFTDEDKLVAFIWSGASGLRVENLGIVRDELVRLTESLQNKIANRIFFKRDGKALYDRLIKPLDLKANHIIFIPDKSLWKIPFQALSPDGRTYLIEHTRITYAPSIAILLQQLKKPAPNRETFQVFSNARYNGLYLRFAEEEAKNLAALYQTNPITNTSEAQFRNMANRSDIVHLSMHAEVNQEEPFNSFMGFKPTPRNDGKLTVNELLKLKLKKGSLVFLASCQTTNVFRVNAETCG